MLALINISKIITLAAFICLFLVFPAWADFTEDLHPGMDHPQVYELQKLLNNIGYTVSVTGDGSKGMETSIMGPATVSALKRFQTANNITPTGVVGPLTRIALGKVGVRPGTTSAPSVVSALPVVTGPVMSFVTMDLGLGVDHPQVKTLQQILNYNGYTVAFSGEGSKGMETTYMGSSTLDAVKRFQAVNKITQTGIVDIHTRIALLKTQLNNLLVARIKSGGSITPIASPVVASADSSVAKVTTTVATTAAATTTKRKRSGGGSSGGGGGGSTTPAPVATLAMSSSTVASGTAVTITWSSTNATSCTGINFSTGSATSGSTVVNPTVSTTYTVSCSGSGGSDTETATVTVSSTSAPVATLSASASSVTSGASVTLTWSSINATSCTGTNFSTGSATSGSTVVNPTATTTYTLSCTGTGGSDVDTETVTILSNPAPTATLSTSASSVASGASVTVTWSSTNATSCTGTNFSTGSATSGSVVVNPTTSTTYTVSCTGAGGTDDDSRTVTVVPAPVATLSVSTSTVASGASVTVTWSSTNATSCTGTNFSTASATSGSVVVNPTSSTTYTVSCTGVGGSDDDSRTVTVVPAPVATLSVSSSTVASGASVTVTWSSTNATSCTGTNFSTGSATSGSTVVNPTVSTTYTVSCTGVGGSDDDSRTVTVSDGTSDITISASASRTSGVAPLAVFFDATGTTDPGTTMPFHELEYRWNFGDTAGGATWNYGARPGVNSRNVATGGVAAHVFETPGTYTVNLDVVGESGTESTELTITVTDPDTVFSGTNTRCISRTGNFTGCPSGAEQVTTTDINTVVSHIATGRRILFRKGETWSDTIFMGGINGPGIIGSYGTGASPIFTGINIGSANTSDWRVMDVDFVRPTGELYATAVEVVHPSSRMTFLRVNATGAGSDDNGSFITFAMNIYDTPSSVNQHVEHAIVDSEITGGRYSFYGAGDKLAFMGNYIEALGGGQHVYRSFYANKGVNTNNTFAGGGDAMGWGPISLVKQHAPDQPGAYTEYLYWSDNRFAPTNVYVSLGFGSENNITDQRPRNIVVERNWFDAQYNAQLGVNMSAGSDFTVRNNLFVMDNFEGTAVQVQHESTGPATTNAHIYNNTFYKSDGGGQGMTAIQILDAGVSAVVRNNIGYAPNATNPVMVSVLFGATDVTQSNNSSDTQLRTVTPNFSSATPITLQHFDLLSGSYGRNTGFAVPVFSDLLNRVRPVGLYDMGALEAQ